MNVENAEILIVDDDLDVGDTVRGLLENAGFPCYYAYDGAQSLDIIRKANINLVICDISMPGMSGLDTLEKVRQMGLPPAFVMLTGHEEKEKIVRALQLGAFDYVTKPFNIPAFISRVPIWLEIGRRSKLVHSAPDNFDDPNDIKRHLRTLDLFRIKNQKLTPKTS